MQNNKSSAIYQYEIVSMCWNTKQQPLVYLFVKLPRPGDSNKCPLLPI